jgi:2-haloacid dehalogenase
MTEPIAGTVAFDVIGTLFSLDRVRDAFRDAGAPEGALERWFAASLRDYFAVSHSGAYVPMREVLAEGLDEPLRAPVMSAMAELPAAPGAVEACALLADSGWRLLTLTNSSEDMTRALLEGAGLTDRFHAILSCDSIGISKPHPDVYALAAGRASGPLWMVASHIWDIGGAARAGLRTAWLQHEGVVWPGYLSVPDLVANDLADLARAILATQA